MELGITLVGTISMAMRSHIKMIGMLNEIKNEH